MNMIEKVKDCQEFGDHIATTSEMRDILAILSKFQLGDAKTIEDLATWLSCSDEPDQFKSQIDCMRRIRDMAGEMERSR